MRSLSLAILLAVCISAPASAARKKKPDPKLRANTVVVMLPETGADAAVVAGVIDFFSQASGFYPEFKVLLGEQVKKRFPRRVAKCSTDILCVARLGRKANVAEVLLARAVPLETGGARIQFLAVDVEKREIVRTHQIDFASQDRVRPELAKNFFQVVGIDTPGYVEIPHAPATIEVDGLSVSYQGTPVKLPPGLHVVRVGTEEQKTMVLPGEIRKLEFDSLKALQGSETAVADAGAIDGEADSEVPVDDPEPAEDATADGGGVIELALVDPANGQDVSAAEPVAVEMSTAAAGGPGTLGWVGVGVAAVGVAVTGVGAYYGTQTRVETTARTTQLEAQRRNRSARTAADRATWMLPAGLALVAAGGALFGIDLLTDDAPAPAVAAVPTAGGVMFGLSCRF